jgi:putative ABC transport system permease protein
LFSVINILGLTVALTCAFTLILFIRDDLSFDKFHSHVQSIYRVNTEVQSPDGSVIAKFGGSSLPVGPLAKEKVAGVESFSRVRPVYYAIKVGDDVQSQRVIEVDPNFFSFFSFRLIEGDRFTVFDQPRNVVIDESTSERLFGNGSPIGKAIPFVIGDQVTEYVVSGVAANCPSNSSIQFKVLMPLSTEPLGREAWLSGNSNIFLKLAERSDPQLIEGTIQKEVDEASKDAIADIRAMGYQEQFKVRLQSITDIHLSTDFPADGSGVESGGSSRLLRVLSIITFFIVLIACINFVNLTMARSATRAKEIGIRKVIGGQRRNLVFQFVDEAFILGGIAFLCAIILTVLIQPIVNELAGKNLSIFNLFGYQNIVWFTILFALVCFSAALYPALVLSSWRPHSILYNRFRIAGGGYLQKSLVVVQFGFATIIIASTLVVYQQVQFMVSQGRGIDLEDVIAVTKQHMTPAQAQLLRNELLKLPSIVGVSMSSGTGNDARIGVDSVIHFDMDIVDAQYLPLLGIKLAVGRNFSDSIASDVNSAIIVNEAFVQKAGWRNAIGKEVLMFPYTDERRVVIGVLKNYYNRSVANIIEPQVLIPATGGHAEYSMALIKIKPGSEAQSVTQIQNSFRHLFPTAPFQYTFLEDDNIARYRPEIQIRKMTFLASIVTIIISCTGLFGLSIATSERRYREISIRKILGATERIIVSLLFRSILTPVLLGVVVALPLAWYAVQMWLSQYPYRIDAKWIVFGGSLGVIATLALLTIVYHAIRASKLNVVDAMKTE